MKLRSINLLFLLLFSLCVQGQDRKAANLLHRKGVQWLAQGNSVEAGKAFTAAIAADSSLYDAWIKRGFVAGMNGDFEGEMRDYSHVIAVDDKHLQAYLSRGAAYNRLKEYDKALADFNTAIALNPASAEAFHNRGFTLKLMGDPEAACRDWRKALQLGHAESRIILKNNHCP